MSSSSEEGTRVWIKAEAVDAALNNAKQPPRFALGRSASFTRKSSTSQEDVEITSSSSQEQQGVRHLTWNWLVGTMLESSNNGTIVVKLNRQDEEGVLEQATSTPTTSIELPAQALGTDVLLANDLACNEEGIPIPPSDLIQLTHLHEPSVVHCLRFRYAQNAIYTATGPVLLALNPFQPIRGLYGESSMRRYWDSSNSNSTKSKTTKQLEPHVYAIADASFRSMMRRMEEDLGRTSSSPSTTTTSGDETTTTTTTSTQTCNQSILVSGESGAGKTVTTKFVMKYLAALSQKSIKTPTKRAHVLAKASQSSQDAPKLLERLDSGGGLSLHTIGGAEQSNHHSIEAQVLQSNPILESFGNARTVRNDNSSRFGKFIEIQFTSSGKLVGASIETYLLEKVRLLHQAQGERNYHVFFEVLQGMDSAQLRQYFIAKTATPQDFKMLNSSGTLDRRDGVTDQETYKNLRVAMNTMKLSKEEQGDIFGITTALLHASNLTFVSLEEECELDFDNVHLQPVCHLLGVSMDALNEALCFFHIQAGTKMESVRRSLSSTKAWKGLEALIKATYGSLFTHLVRRINDSIAYNSEQDEEDDDWNEWRKPAATIGVLDIFGFESFARNSFEQLCINYCNEALQQQFNAFVLKNEQAIYEQEGIEWSFIEFPENQDVLDLIDKRGSGLLPILDDQCRAPGTSDRSFASDVYGKLQHSTRFRANRKQQSQSQFEILHYAGPVEYTTDGFVEKNRDELPKESTELLKSSTNPFVQHLAAILESTTSSGETNNMGNSMASSNTTCSDQGGGGYTTPYKLKRSDTSSLSNRFTVGGQFRRQLRELRRKIDLTSPHYIRCLKPNDFLVPDTFDAAIVAEQLKCGGILEAVRVSRAGFTQHYPHADFIRRYRGLGKLEWMNNNKRDTNVSNRHTGTSPLWAKSSSSLSSPIATPKSSYSGRKWGTPGRNGSHGGFTTPTPRSSNGGFTPRSSGRNGFTPENNATESSNNPQNPKQQCVELLKVIYKKLVDYEKESFKENVPAPSEQQQQPSSVLTAAAAPVKSKSYSYSSSTPPPSWKASSSRGGLPPTPKTAPPNMGGKLKTNYPSWATNQNNNNKSESNGSNATMTSTTTTTTSSPTTTTTPSYHRGGGYRRGNPSSSDFAKVGIQLGKTKVFLRHKAFEALERIRSTEQSVAATKLNAMFRMYLSRIAYLPIRNAYRLEMKKLYGNSAFADKEHKEDEERRVAPSKSTTKRSWSNTTNASHLIAQFESQMRASIHNPVPRNQWGKQRTVKPFKWMLVDGLWVKNPSYEMPPKDDEAN